MQEARCHGWLPPIVEYFPVNWIPASTIAPALFYYSTSCAYPAGMTYLYSSSEVVVMSGGGTYLE